MSDPIRELAMVLIRYILVLILVFLVTAGSIIS